MKIYDYLYLFFYKLREFITREDDTKKPQGPVIAIQSIQALTLFLLVFILLDAPPTLLKSFGFLPILNGVVFYYIDVKFLLTEAKVKAILEKYDQKSNMQRKISIIYGLVIIMITLSLFALAAHMIHDK